MIDGQLKQSQAVRFINTWLSRNDYSNLFENDIGLMLAENRRSRRSNFFKYGSIPYEKDHTGHVRYKLEDLQDLCENRLKPICKELEIVRLKRAERATGASAVCALKQHQK